MSTVQQPSQAADSPAEPAQQTPQASSNGATSNGAPVATPPPATIDEALFPEDLQAILANVRRVGADIRQQDQIVRAYRLAEDAHAHQTRRSGEPYVLHPLAVARIISDRIPDPDMISAAILHDVLEDSPTTHQDLLTRFNAEVAMMVEGVTKLSKLETKSAVERQAESTKKMFYAMGKDIRVLLIKLADRLHNMRTLGALREEKQRAISQETLDFYAPLSHRLGMYRLKSELEDLAFKFLHPDDYTVLAEQVALKRDDRDRIVTEAVAAVKHLLTQKGIKCSVKGRAKHLYSIWTKMHRDDLKFDELYDLFALRIVIDSQDEADCYRVLGLVHSVWQPIYEKLKDYIGRPKSNGYKSIHTVVIGPEGRPLEIQIRTKEMDERAEYGIAAHYLYKEGKEQFTELDSKLSWLRDILERQEEEVAGSERYIADLKTDLITEEVLVFTPRGDVITLPTGGTPIDFAYHIHTDVGHACRGAQVNGKMVKLDKALKSGDIVEVILQKGSGIAPSRGWLAFVKSNRAASKIRAYFRRLDDETNEESGREDLEKEQKKAGLAHLNLISEANLKKVLPDYELRQVPALYRAIGRGEIHAQNVINRLRQKLITDLKQKTHIGKVVPLTERVPLEGRADQFGLEIDGAGDYAIHLSKCCLPVHGDTVVGYVTRGRGIALHRQGCKAIHGRQFETERMIPAKWVGKPAGVMYLAAIDLWVLDRVGLLSEVTQSVANVGVNVSGLKLALAKDKTAKMRIRIQVGDIEEITKTLKKLGKIQDVLEAKRASGM